MPTIHPDYSTPLTWSPLWDAIGDEYHNANIEKREPRLILTTESMADEMLCVVPPRMQSRAGFLVGEANHHNNAGEAVYSAFLQIGHDWFARYATVREFRLLDSAPISAPVDAYEKERAKPVEWLECCCCGSAFKGRQWWNQDIGFGLGDCCMRYHGISETGGESSAYGVPGIHFRLPPEPVDVNAVNELHLTADELRAMAEREISRGFNVDYWQEVLKAI